MGETTLKRRTSAMLMAAITAVFIAAAVLTPLTAGGGIRARHASAAEIMRGGDAQDAADSELLPGETVNINTASAAELARLPGIGPVLSGRIVAYREENGAFSANEEIMNVDGIGRTRYAAIAALITTGADGQGGGAAIGDAK